MRPALTIIALAVAASLLVATGASADRERILRDAHLQRCPTDAPCSQCFWPSTGDYKYIYFCAAGGAAEGASCRCKSNQGWQTGVVLMSHPDRVIGH